jgi:predicted phosphodiesterase
MQSFQRLAIVSDIHGNYEGLLKVLEDAEREQCDGIVCLGDLVDGGPADMEVVTLIRERAIPTVRGNHDDTNDLALPWDDQQFLWSLPFTLTCDDILLTHISPRRRATTISDRYEAWNVFDECEARLIFVGHAHRAQFYGEMTDRSAESAEYEIVRNQPIELDPDDRYIVCVGAVGYSRETIQKPQYCIYDRARETIEYRAVDGPLIR